MQRGLRTNDRVFSSSTELPLTHEFSGPEFMSSGRAFTVKKIWLFFVLAFLCLPGSAFTSRRQTVDPRVREVRTIFIKGNNEAAVGARQNLSRWTCFRLVNSPSLADATLEFSQQQSVSGAIFSANRERSIVSAELTAKSGDVRWSGSATQDAGLINTGAGGAASYVLRQLEAAAFPQVKIGFRGLDQSGCPAVSQPTTATPETATAGTAAASPESGVTPTTGTKEIKFGMTTDQVEKILGVPATKVDLGEKVLYKYKDMTIEFHDGKVTDVR